MGLRKCCVGGCTSTSETHRLFLFPKNDNLRALWLSFLVPTNPYLAGLTKRQLICKRVCSKHFDRQQFDEEGQRLRYSYPCLLSDLEIALGEPQSTAEWNLLNEHNYFQKLAVEPQTSADTVREQPSTSFATTSEMEQFSDTSLQTQSKNYGIESAVEVQTSADTVREQPSTSFATTSEMEQFSDTSLHTQSKNYGIESAVEVQTSADTVREQPSTSFATTSEMNYGIESAVKVQTSAIIKRKPSKKGKLVERIKTISAKNLGNSAVQTLQQAQQMLASPVIIENFLALPKHARNFIEVQLKHVNKKKMARRFTLDEKLMALSIMKQSPKGYKLLEKMFTLPNKRTLSRVSENIDFEPGLNPHIFEHLKKTVNNWDEKKKLCSILYDEVALTPHITFDENKDEIIGFVDVNGKKKMAYCDHALVFMVRGVCASWRQCIAYHFVQGTVSAAELKVILKDVVVQVAQTGLIPVALVSDQGSTFRTTIRNLRLDSNRSRTLEGLRDDGTVNVAGHSLNVFFDPPHLLKSLRNNFINKDVLWGDKMASWKDILYVYDIDSKLGLTRALPKLTAYHVDHNKMRKMKVSIAAQVLSARTAAMLKYTDAIRQDPQSTMTTTAEFVEFVDTLFDSVNGYPGGGQRGKLRKAVKSDSAHAKFWSSAIKQLKSIKFIDRNSKAAVKSGARYVRVPCLEGWITSLESFIRLSKLLFEKYHVDFYYPRYINQDPLENFFGRLRALNYRNTNPDANTFKYSFKSLMLSNVLSPHSRFSNCEQDEGETIMAINHMFNKKRNVNKENEMIDDKENVSPNSNDYANLITSCSQNSPGDLMGQVIDEKMRVHCSAYAAGFICRKITKTTNCKQCIKTYISQNIENIHMYIRYREYKTLKNNNLAYPNENFLRLYRDATQLIHSYLNVFCHRKHDLGLKLKNMLLSKLPLLYDIGCNIHKRKVQDLFLKIVIRLQVHNWCKIINKILKGAIEEKYVLKMNEPQKMALKKYESFRIRKKCLKI